jgi:hypothetical protein
LAIFGSGRGINNFFIEFASRISQKVLHRAGLFDCQSNHMFGGGELTYRYGRMEMEGESSFKGCLMEAVRFFEKDPSTYDSSWDQSLTYWISDCFMVVRHDGSAHPFPQFCGRILVQKEQESQNRMIQSFWNSLDAFNLFQRRLSPIFRRGGIMQGSHSRKQAFRHIYLAVIILVLFSLACSVTGSLDATASPRQRANTDTVSPTDTVVKKAATRTPTDVTQPTDTPDEEGTLTAEATLAAEAIVPDITAILSKAGSPAGTGYLVYAGKEGKTVTASGYNAMGFEAMPVSEEIGNFALHSKIAWKSELGIAGCGWTFRVEHGDYATGKYYEFYYNRLSGAPFYSLYAFGPSVSKEVGNGFSNAIDYRDGAVNDVMIIAKDTEFQIFFNGQRVNVFYDSTVRKGQFGYYTWTESASSSCTFSDNWIWSWDAR